MLKKMLMSASALVVAAGLVVGWGTLGSLLRGFRAATREAIEDARSDVQRAAEIRALLQELDEKVLQFADRLGEAETRGAEAGRRVRKVGEELELERGLLRRVKGLLDEDRGCYRVGGRDYSRTEVCADAATRLARSEQLARQLAFERKAARQIEEAVVEARENLGRAQLLRQQKAAELAALEVRLENAKLLAQVNDLTREMKGGSLGPQTELGRSLEAFERRVASLERRSRLTGEAPRGRTGVDWEGGKNQPAAVRDAIVRFLDRGAEVTDK